MTRQKNKRGDSKEESNDSSEIPDSGETSDVPGLPSGATQGRRLVIDRNARGRDQRNVMTREQWCTRFLEGTVCC